MFTIKTALEWLNRRQDVNTFGPAAGNPRRRVRRHQPGFEGLDQRLMLAADVAAPVAAVVPVTAAVAPTPTPMPTPNPADPVITLRLGRPPKMKIYLVADFQTRLNGERIRARDMDELAQQRRAAGGTPDQYLSLIIAFDAYQKKAKKVSDQSVDRLVELRDWHAASYKKIARAYGQVRAQANALREQLASAARDAGIDPDTLANDRIAQLESEAAGLTRLADTLPATLKKLEAEGQDLKSKMKRYDKRNDDVGKARTEVLLWMNRVQRHAVKEKAAQMRVEAVLRQIQADQERLAILSPETQSATPVAAAVTDSEDDPTPTPTPDTDFESDPSDAADVDAAEEPYLAADAVPPVAPVPPMGGGSRDPNPQPSPTPTPPPAPTPVPTPVPFPGDPNPNRGTPGPGVGKRLDVDMFKAAFDSFETQVVSITGKLNRALGKIKISDEDLARAGRNLVGSIEITVGGSLVAISAAGAISGAVLAAETGPVGGGVAWESVGLMTVGVGLIGDGFVRTWDTSVRLVP